MADTDAAPKVLRDMREKHLQDNPDCPYGNQPHFVPPGFGMVGFYACQPPEDGRNHTRCRPPYDHEHEHHRAPKMASYDQGAVDALRSLAESFAETGMREAAAITFRAVALVEAGTHLG